MGASCTKNPQCAVNNEEKVRKDVTKNKNKKIARNNITLPSEKKKKSISHQVPRASEKITSMNLNIFTFAELKSCTNDFGQETFLGVGGFGWVFKGWIDPKNYAPANEAVGIPVAIKICKPDSEQGLKQWQAEVKLLGKFCHQNLVKLLGYCNENGELLLVYEYMQNGSLESHLFKKDGKALLWDTRLKIAIEAARGLTFLHTTEKQVIYRDFKTSNILLDEDFNAKLSDFGYAKLGPADGKSHVTTEVAGTYGYAAPEYVATGHLYVKSDVYGFGVVLLELLTGLRVVDLRRTPEMYNIVKWAKPLLSERDITKIIDPLLKDEYPSKGASQLAELIEECLALNPKCRPSMEEVLDKLEQIRAGEDFEGQHFVWRIF